MAFSHSAIPLNQPNHSSSHHSSQKRPIRIASKIKYHNHFIRSHQLHVDPPLPSPVAEELLEDDRPDTWAEVEEAVAVTEPAATSGSLGTVAPEA